MPFDLATLIPLLVSVLGALGIGSLIVQWAAGGKDRRAARAAALEKLAAAEDARWQQDLPEAGGSAHLAAALRQLETAALIARIPRAAVLPYLQLATASLWLLQEDAERHGGEAVGLDVEVADVVVNAAEIVSRAAWSPSATRWLWLQRRVRRLNGQVRSIEDASAQNKIANARRFTR